MKMLSKKKKIIILVAMVALLVVTGYLNIALNNNVVESSANVTEMVDFYDGYRTDRQSSRQTAITYYDSIIASENSTEEAKALAQESRQQLISALEKELVVEGLLKSAGFEDAILTTTTSNVNVIVKSSELTAAEVAKIVNIIQEQLGTSLENIKIIPSN